MEKRNVNRDLSFNLWRGFLLLTFFFLFFLPFVSAQFGFGYGFSIEGFLDSFFNSETSIYILLFFIMFTIFTLSLVRLRFFRGPYGQPNSFAAGIVSFCISALAVYYLYQSGFQGESLFSWLGISRRSLSLFVIILVILIIILIIWKLKFVGFFIFGGLALILTSIFTDIIYERGLATIIGFVFLVIGLWLWQRTRGMVGSAGGWLGRHAMAGARKKPMWAVAIGGFILAAIGFAIGQIIVMIAGILMLIIGMAGKRVYSETPFATGRNMSARRAETEAYQEEAQRQRIAQNRAHEEAIRVQSQIEQIQAQINLIDNNIRRYQRAIRGARSLMEAANIRNGIIDLENQKKDLLNALRQLTHG